MKVRLPGRPGELAFSPEGRKLIVGIHEQADDGGNRVKTDKRLLLFEDVSTSGDYRFFQRRQTNTLVT